MYCKFCGKEISDEAKFCPFCGSVLGKEEVIQAEVVRDPSASHYSRGLALILACVGFFFVSGLHRFYVGKTGTGIVWLLTFGCFGVGTIIDVIMLVTGSFKDSEEKCLTKWNIE